jgi:dCTP deaminase
MILSDSEIKKRLISWDIWVETDIKYDIIKQVWPASLDFRLGYFFKYYRRKNQTVIDVKEWVKSKHVWMAELSEGEKFILHPWDFILSSTLESFKIPTNLVARCEWRSSLWRLGLIIHSTAGFIDPWFEWTITLEMTNINEVPIVIYPWMRIWQLAFETILWKVETPYNKRESSKYMKQIKPEESKIQEDEY